MLTKLTIFIPVAIQVRSFAMLKGTMLIDMMN